MFSLEWQTLRWLIDELGLDGDVERGAGLSRGIGLSGVAESLAAVGGAIRLDTAHRPGACFVIELPHEAKVERNRSGVRKLDFAPRVLVVEDDAALRDLLVATFELEGIVVEARRDSLPDEIQRFDAALVDLRLDGEGDGLSLAEELRNRGFAGPIHLMSGGEPPHETWSEGLHFHRKPFDPTAVAAAGAHAIRPVVAASMGA
jgi:CheY-like chemotaxis protein